MSNLIEFEIPELMGDKKATAQITIRGLKAFNFRLKLVELLVLPLLEIFSRLIYLDSIDIQIGPIEQQCKDMTLKGQKNDE